MRADRFFADRFGSRTKAQNELKNRRILLNGKPVLPKDEVSGDEPFEFLCGEKFVSEGGKKLSRGLDRFGESVKGLTVADLGASTGGFTDCLLQNGAKKVYCVDVGESQLDLHIACDPRVVVMDKTNARYLNAGSFPERIDTVTGDLSFISLKLILPAVADILSDLGKAFLLFKPQFECEGKGLGNRGILPIRYHRTLLDGFYDECLASGLSPQNIVNAPVVPKKNVEYIVLLQKGGDFLSKNEFLHRAANVF